ncbi:PIN domain-containing protein [Streptomyces sp. M19]
MLIVDTGPIVALLNRNDPDHKSCAELLESHDGELLVTPYVLTEACYLLAKYVSPDAEINLVEAVAAEDLVQVPTERADLSRVAELMQQYRGFLSESPTPQWSPLPSGSKRQASPPWITATSTPSSHSTFQH